MVYKMKQAQIARGGSREDPGIGGLAFAKLHGNGNDFILIDEMRREVIPEEKKSKISASLCSRNFGIGGDGALYLIPSDEAQVGMRLFQPDGSEAEMCGNGIRCLAKYAWDQGYVGDIFGVETLAGLIPVEVILRKGVFWARLDMGVPRFERTLIPARGSGDFIGQPMSGHDVSAVNTGVPHAVIFVDDLSLPVADLAPPIRHNPMFPQGTNVNFVKVGDSFSIRTFERGVEAETLSCGTGSVASAAVARRLGLVGDEVLVQTMGGPLNVLFRGERAILEGPAVTVFYGQLERDYLGARK